MDWHYFYLTYFVQGLFRIPCRFNLRKYPFASQECSLTFNVETQSSMTLKRSWSSFERVAKIRLPERTIVGEYILVDCYVAEFTHRSVTLFFKFAPFYSYHLLSSFFTSLLIVLISYATFLFQTEDFNERIMVSLTALLVLTALFTQSNLGTVQTSYFKLLDIWYASLITFTFLNVICVTGLNTWQHKLRKSALSLSNSSEDPKMELVTGKMNMYNYICLAILFGCFSSFCVVLILYAVDII